MTAEAARSGRIGTPDDGPRSWNTTGSAWSTPRHRSTPTRPVFVDSSGRRRQYVRRLGLVLAVSALGYVGVLVGTMFMIPGVASSVFPGLSQHHEAADRAEASASAGHDAAGPSRSAASTAAGTKARRTATHGAAASTGTQVESARAGRPPRAPGGSAPAPSRPPVAARLMGQPGNPVRSHGTPPHKPAPAPSLAAPPSATAPPSECPTPTPTASPSPTPSPSSSPSPSATTPTPQASPSAHGAAGRHRRGPKHAKRGCSPWPDNG
jgi:hypothetical protein